jgi:hypothetical protein
MFRWLSILVLLSVAILDASADKVITMQQDSHSVRWNRFVKNVYELHKKNITGKSVREERRIGGYPRHPDFYEEIHYYDSANSRLLGMIQWERDKSERGLDAIHSIAVNIHDNQGRVVRDYSATYLPDYRNAPTQTLIFLHAYNDKLHAWRSFDASGNWINESCSGRYQGKEVDIMQDEDEIAYAQDDPKSVMFTPAYKACFSALPEKAGEYLQPH